MFITGVLGLGGLFGSFGGLGGLGGGHGGFGGFGQFAGIGPHRPGLFAGGGPGLGVPHDSLSGGYYKADDAFKSLQNYYELATTEKEPQYLDSFYNYEKKIIQEKSGKADKEPKDSEELSSRANGYRSFAWKTI